MMHAVKTNSLEIVRTILDDERVDVHVKDAHDRDVIHHVVAIGTYGGDLKPVATFDNLKMLDLVLKFGARPSISALNFARESGAVKIAEKLSKLLHVDLVCNFLEMLASSPFFKWFKIQETFSNILEKIIGSVGILVERPKAVY